MDLTENSIILFRKLLFHRWYCQVALPGHRPLKHCFSCALGT